MRCDSFDHIPLLIVLSGLDIPKQKKIFCFKEMWLLNRGCEEVVFLAWNSGDTLGFEGGVLEKIDKCGKDLTWWNRDVFGSVQRELERLKKLLVEAESIAMASGNKFRVRQLKKEIEVLLDRESTMWAKRSRLLWARNGDRSTKYFHSRATRRFRRNKVEGIRDKEGNWRDQQHDIVVVLVDYFKDLFSSCEANGSQDVDVLSCIPTVIDDEMNGMLS